MPANSSYDQRGNSIISYSLAGEQSAGTSLFFLNGMYRGKESWIKQIRNEMLRKKYKMIFMDYPGFGDSVFTEDYGSYLDLVAENVLFLLDREQVKQTSLIGYSLGGVFACWFASLYPDRVKSLVLINSGFHLSVYMKMLVRQSMKLLASDIDFSMIYPYIYVWHYSEDYLEKIIDYEQVQNTFFGNEYIKNKKAMFEMLNIATRLETYRQCTAKIQCPVLLIGSNQDMVLPLFRQENDFPNRLDVELKSIPGASHAAIIENYQEVNNFLVDFLDKYSMNISTRS